MFKVENTFTNSKNLEGSFSVYLAECDVYLAVTRVGHRFSSANSGAKSHMAEVYVYPANGVHADQFKNSPKFQGGYIINSITCLKSKGGFDFEPTVEKVTCKKCKTWAEGLLEKAQKTA